MKSPLIKILFVCLLALTLAACSPAAFAVPQSPAVQIPPELKVALNGLILFGVTFGLQWLFETVHLDLRGIGAVVAATAAEFLVLQFQGWIDMVPAQYDLYVTLGLNILLAILTTLGYVRVVFQWRRARQLLDSLTRVRFMA